MNAYRVAVLNVTIGLVTTRRSPLNLDNETKKSCSWTAAGTLPRRKRHLHQLLTLVPDHRQQCFSPVFTYQIVCRRWPLSNTPALCIRHRWTG